MRLINSHCVVVTATVLVIVLIKVETSSVVSHSQSSKFSHNQNHYHHLGFLLFCGRISKVYEQFPEVKHDHFSLIQKYCLLHYAKTSPSLAKISLYLSHFLYSSKFHPINLIYTSLNIISCAFTSRLTRAKIHFTEAVCCEIDSLTTLCPPERSLLYINVRFGRDHVVYRALHWD